MKSKPHHIVSNGIHRGFTLTEILVVMLITSVIVLSVNASFHQVHAIWVKIESPRSQFQVTRLLFETLRNEFTGLYIPPTNGETQTASPFHLELTENDQQVLSFFSLNPSWHTSTHISKPTKITYAFIKDPSTDVGSLERTEQWWSADTAIGSERSSTVATGLLHCEFLAIGPDINAGDTSGQTTSTAKESPPKAIRVRLTWAQKKPDEKTVLETCLFVPCRGGVPKS